MGPELEEMIEVARGEKPCDLLLKNGKIVNVFAGEIHDGNVAIYKGKIAGIGDYKARKNIDLKGKYICPGFLDGHVHIESAMVTPPEYARAVVPLGTTTVVILAGALLEKAEALIDKNVHPTVIVDGYSKAAEKALEIANNIAVSVDPIDKSMLKKVAMTSMASKLVSENRDFLSNLAVDAVLQVAQKMDEGYKVELDDIKVEKKPGASIEETQFIKGISLDKEVVHPGMPKLIKKAKVAMLDCPLEIEKTEFDAEIRIRDPTQVKAFLDQETRMLGEMVEKIKAAGANVVICQKGIDDMAQHFLAKEGILAVRRAKESDMEKLAKATGGRIVNNIDDLTPEDLGEAGLVEERKIGDDKMVFIEKCKNPKAVAIFIRGGTDRLVDEAERSIHDALCVVRDVVQEP